jgi:cytochrome c oxidase cbb3-type subunit 3
MSDFTSNFWSLFIAVLTVAGILACALLLKAMSTRRKSTDAQAKLHGHVWDEDLAEYDNPLPRWWMGLFLLTIVFSLGYVVLYPGLGSYEGVLKWSSTDAYRLENEQAEARYGPTFSRYLEQGLAVVAEDSDARAAGQRLFLNYCAQCHGSDARGGIGFPNLRDTDWLYGGDPESIKATIMDGRNGVMPPMGAAIGGADGAKYVMHYLFSLGGRSHDSVNAALGKQRFGACAACHGIDGKGNKALGAPDLTDDVWLHGSSEPAILQTIMMGRKSQMPAHREFLGEAKSHLLAAYVYGLSLDPGEAAARKAYGREPTPKK